MIRVVAARVISDFTVAIRFSDGVEASVDLSNDLDGPIFEPLRNPEYFRKMEVNHDIHTIAWPNRADFAPEFLYAKVPVPA